MKNNSDKHIGEIEVLKKNKIWIVGALLFILLIIYLVWPVQKQNISEQAIVLDLSDNAQIECLIQEDNYIQDMESVVEPYLKQRKKNGYYKGYAGEQIYYERFVAENEKAQKVMVHGYTDGIYKFKEMTYYFLNAGYTVNIIDQRSHGYSYRELDDLCKVTVHDFEEYVEDLKIFIDTIVLPTMEKGEKLFGYAHSMGGGIITLTAEKYSYLFDAIVLSSPMMEIKYNGFPYHVALLWANIQKMIGNGNSYVAGLGKFDFNYSAENSSANSNNKFEYYYGIEKENVYYQASGGTYNWLLAAIAACEDIKKNVKKYKTKTLLFQAENDSIVGDNGQNWFVKNTDCVTQVVVPDTKHSILLSKQEIFVPYLNMILDFFEKNE